MKLIQPLLSRARRTHFAQAARMIEHPGLRGNERASAREVGADTRYDDEPIRFLASPRMATVANDLDAAGDDGGAVELTSNILGLAGATPALPAFYSELQLQRRRLRDRSLTDFLAIFNHRALSFFYRAARKHHWAIGYEREPKRGSDKVTRLLLALGGLGFSALRGRQSTPDEVFAPLAGQIGGMRRSAAAVATTLSRASGTPVRIREMQPTWMPIPASEQTRLGAPLGRGHAGTLGDTAVVGAAVLDVQHHFDVELGPLGYPEFLRFCSPGGPRRQLGELTALAAGLPYRARARLLIAPGEVPPLQLGVAGAPALLGQTTWMRPDITGVAPLADCTVSLSLRDNQLPEESH
jgi:type VI secretion system protein ImpH